MNHYEPGQGRIADPVDANDIRLALGGDGAAFGRIVDRYQSAAARYMWRFTREPNVLEDLVQEVFVEAYCSLPGYRGDGPFLHWLKQISTRVGFRHWKRRERERRNVHLPDGQWPEPEKAEFESIESREAARIVHEMLLRLPPRDRLVLTLLYLQGCSVADAARLAGWSPTMVKVQAFRARQKLKQLLEKVRK